MAYIPEDAKWYLADIVEENRVEGSKTSLVHVNLVLIRADSPEEAYARALEIGQQSNMTYENVAGKTVTVTFRGLRDLNVIHDELEHGAELAYERKVDVSEAQIQKIVRPKDVLGVFDSSATEPNLDYMPGDIYHAVEEEVKRRNETPSSD
jgi:hypothetical protein